MTLDFYGLAEQITALEQILATVDDDAPLSARLSLAPVLADLAWYLRQRDTSRAIALADRCESLLSRAKAESRWPSIVGRLSLIRGEAARLFSRFDESLYYLSVGYDQFKLVGDANGAGDALVLMAGVYGDRGRLDEQRQHLDRAIKAYAVHNTPLRLAFAQTARALSGSIAAPDETFYDDEGSDPCPTGDCSPLTHPALQGAALARQAYTAYASGHALQAATLARQALPLCREGGRLRLAVAMASLAAVAYAALYDGAQASAWMEHSLALAQEVQWPWGLAVATVRSAWVLHRLTLPDAALDLLNEAENTIALLGESRITALADCARGDALLDLGKAAEASEFFAKAQRWSERRGDQAVAHHAMVGQARTCLLDGDLNAGLRLARDSLRLADAMDSPLAQLVSLDVLMGLSALPNAANHGPLQDQWTAQAVALIDGHADVAPPPSLFTALAHLAAERGDMGQAYNWQCRSTALRKQLETGRTRGRAATLSARRRSEQAQKEVDALRHTANMESARADALSRMVHTLERLSSVGQDIAANLDRAGILSTLTRCGRTILGPESTYTIYLPCPDDGRLKPLSAGLISPSQTGGDQGEQDDPEVAAALETVLYQRFETVLRSPEGVRDGMILSPLLNGDHCRGILQITSRTAFDEHTRAIARSLALFTSNALGNADHTEALGKANASLERIAHYDALTDIPNRRYFYETASNEIKRAQRHQRPLAVLMLDIDFFKKVNDTYGHAGGDAVLVAVAKTLANGLRPGDMVGRLGGEEFAVLLPDSDAQAALATAKRLREQVEALTIPHDDQILTATISIGASIALPSDPSLDHALQRADHALYAAKNNGRNRVEHAFSPLDKGSRAAS